MKPFFPARKDRACIPDIVAGCDDEVEALPQEFINGFGALARQVNSLFSRHLDGHRMNPGGGRSRAENLESFSPVVPEQALRYLAPGRIMGAEKENPGFSCRHIHFLLPGFFSIHPSAPIVIVSSVASFRNEAAYATSFATNQ